MWAVLDGAGTVTVRCERSEPFRELQIAGPGAYLLVEHDRHSKGVLELEIGEGVRCLATCFTPGLI